MNPLEPPKQPPSQVTEIQWPPSYPLMSTPTNHEAAAYPSSSASLRGKLLLVLGVVIGVFVLRNMLVKDYSSQTKVGSSTWMLVTWQEMQEYLIQTGHAEDIQQVLPRTRSDYMNEEMSRLRWDEYQTSLDT